MSTAKTKATQELEDLLSPILEKLENKNFDLPPLSQVATRVLELTTDQNTDTAKLNTLIQQDPILAAKIFQIANSPAFGATRKIETLQQAISWLGHDHVAWTAFTLSVLKGVFNVCGYESQVKELWAQSIGAGFYAKTIAQVIGQDPDTAYLCGLLHAIGKPFVVHTINQDRKPTDPPIPWTTMTLVIKESYVEVGRQLADAWGFPSSVKEAINLHDDYSYHLGTSPTQCAPIICLANHLISLLFNQEEIHEELPVIQFLKISKDDVNSLLESQQSIQAKIETILI